MRKMRRANKALPGRDGAEQRAKDRELIDLLWAMEKVSLSVCLCVCLSVCVHV